MSMEQFFLRNARKFMSYIGIKRQYFSAGWQFNKILFEVAELHEQMMTGDNKKTLEEIFDLLQATYTMLELYQRFHINDKDICAETVFPDWQKKIESYLSKGGKYYVKSIDR